MYKSCLFHGNSNIYWNIVKNGFIYDMEDNNYPIWYKFKMKLNAIYLRCQTVIKKILQISDKKQYTISY